MDAEERALNAFIEESDEEDEQGTVAHVSAAFERTYADERSWEALGEDEHGRLIASRSSHALKRKRPVQDTTRVRRGLIRFLQLGIDMSATCASATDFRPSRAAALVALSKTFISEFFDQNPLSQLSIMSLHSGAAQRLSQLSASPENHRRVLEQRLDSGGAVSLQNVLEQAVKAVQPVPPHGYRECLILLSSLTTCDPGDISAAIELAVKAKLHVSIIGLSAEMYVSKNICQATGGSYSVAMSEAHLHELVKAHCNPPPATEACAVPNVVRMGFPSKDADGPASSTFVGESCTLKSGAYTCPRCLAKSAELPCQCHTCGITLISSPHLARSYHHLFPLPPFVECELEPGGHCFACALPLSCETDLGNVLTDGADASSYKCPLCEQVFCSICDVFVHDHLHNCPGCECKQV